MGTFSKSSPFFSSFSYLQTLLAAERGIGKWRRQKIREEIERHERSEQKSDVWKGTSQNSTDKEEIREL